MNPSRLVVAVISRRRDSAATELQQLRRMRHGGERASCPLFISQHYELPPEFFLPIMGDRLKYSSCIFPPGVGDDDINAAEVVALLQVEQSFRLTCCCCCAAAAAAFGASAAAAAASVAVAVAPLMLLLLRERRP